MIQLSPLETSLVPEWENDRGSHTTSGVGAVKAVGVWLERQVCDRRYPSLGLNVVSNKGGMH